jgi:hypothetical protein
MIKGLINWGIKELDSFEILKKLRNDVIRNSSISKFGNNDEVRVVYRSEIS